MIAFQKGTFRVLEPVTATLFAASPIEFVVNHYTDVILNPLKYNVPYELSKAIPEQEGAQSQFTIKMDFSYLVEATSSQKQILNNFGVVQINELRTRVPVIITKDNEDLCVTFL